ncbi:DUF4007 family protein [Persicitalea jodogahamensis]|uniref:DUF4007 domain-containing protein n=1 Tax=Persicitalea jodogahamensis TaxID=402147 RepID=A0A8J3GBL7_9BACT|nr:DUF4007 family protein [Persicitalea jodogahamensis]GHB82852.1 hypothetical protein GCM10007390_42170 [Persicitalea jodogahamensis]
MIETLSPVKYTFSGHDTFHCRSLWLKKGYDYLLLDKKFSDDDAVVVLGVGKNMVSAIRYWMKAFALSDSDDQPTELAHWLFDDEKGFDPYLEDEGTLWLLHFHLVVNNHASIYNLIFNTYRRLKIEFSAEDFLKYIGRLSSTTAQLNVSDSTVGSDFGVFTKMYLRHTETKSRDEGFTGILTDLNMLGYKKEGKLFYIANAERHELPAEILMYGILVANEGSNSISYRRLEEEANQVGSVFALNQEGLVSKIEALANHYEGIVFSDQAGIMELQFKSTFAPHQVLSDYYANV